MKCPRCGDDDSTGPVCSCGRFPNPNYRNPFLMNDVKRCVRVVVPGDCTGLSFELDAVPTGPILIQIEIGLTTITQRLELSGALKLAQRLTEAVTSVPIPPSPDTDPIGQRIRDTRVARGLTARHVAKVAKMPASMLADIESGRRPNADLDTLYRIALALGINPADLDGRLATVGPGEFAERLEEAWKIHAARLATRKGKPGKKSEVIS